MEHPKVAVLGIIIEFHFKNIPTSIIIVQDDLETNMELSWNLRPHKSSFSGARNSFFGETKT